MPGGAKTSPTLGLAIRQAIQSLKCQAAPAFAEADFVCASFGKIRRQRAAAQSSLTDRINLSIAEAFVNVGSLTSVESTHPSRPAQFPYRLFFLAPRFFAAAIRESSPGTVGCRGHDHRTTVMAAPMRPFPFKAG